ncbi:ABC transporter ATP-binding protein [Cytobacillus kochii]
MKNHQPIFELDSFSFSFDKHDEPSVNNVSCKLYAEEVTLLLGASGSGKSTLTLCLNGLYPEAIDGFTSGDLLYKGRNISSYPKGVINQEIGIVFQDPESQFCMVRVEDELAFVLENLSIPRCQMKQRIEHVLDIVGLSQYMKHNIHHLSGGQKQKVALASILLMDPQYLILDEPTANLDPISSLEFIETIIKIQKQQRFGLLVIEHEIDDWEPYAHRLVALNNKGELLLDSTPKEGFQNHLHKLTKNRIRVPKRYENRKMPIRPSSEKESTKVIVNLKDIQFNYKNKQILNELSFSIKKGDFCAIVGENGAGKSTLLQLIAKLIKPVSGSIDFLNTPLSNWHENELYKNMGYVFQNPEHQFINQTVYDEVCFGIKLRGYSRVETERMAHHLLTDFDLLSNKWKNPFSLSGGQKRRLSVATMLHSKPDLLLFDEPTFGQDAYTTSQFMRKVMHLNDKGATIVFVTHDMDLVDSYCNNVLVMQQGKIVYDGPPKELWRKTELLERARLRIPYRLRLINEEMTI